MESVALSRIKDVTFGPQLSGHVLPKRNLSSSLAAYCSQNADIAQQDDRLELRKLAPHNGGEAAYKKTNTDTSEIDKIGDRARSPAICRLPNMS